MRGLRPAMSAACALTCACVAVSGCDADGTGARGEGPAPSATAASTSIGVTPAIARNPRAMAIMISSDTSVSAQVRKNLAPCGDDHYPVVTATGYLTASDGPDLVVNVTECQGGIGLGAYVYRLVGGKYQNVFTDERPPVYGNVVSGKLQIVHDVYSADDPDWLPTGEESAVYSWHTSGFVETAHVFTDYGGKTPIERPEPTSTEPAPLPARELLDPALASAAADVSASPTPDLPAQVPTSPPVGPSVPPPATAPTATETPTATATPAPGATATGGAG